MCALLLSFLWIGPLLALDSLRVGEKGEKWKGLQESAQFMAVAADSIWIWDVRPANLALGTAVRYGSIRAKMIRKNPDREDVPSLVGKPGLASWIDGDPGTAWSPEEDEELGRQAEVYLDLGATFRVNRIRFFPRLDREHRYLILGSFDIGTNDGVTTAQFRDILGAKYTSVPRLSFDEAFPNRETIVDQQFVSRDVRYIRLSSQEKEPWEIAELEVYSDGTLPLGEFVSDPIFVRGGFPLWGRVWVNGTDIADASIVIQTRAGPDWEPLNYFSKRGDELIKVSKDEYDQIALRPYTTIGVVEEEQGPILPNPEWSPWQTVSDGLVTSPGLERFFQFRVLLSAPGTVLRDLIFEYVTQPLAKELEAEISPLEVDPGTETSFTLSLEVHIDQVRRDTGIRYLEVLTPAEVYRIERVLVDDQEAVYTATYQPGEGFTIDLWERVVQTGSFVQVAFRAALFRDGTTFQVRAVDQRPYGGQPETVYQIADEADVDPLSVGGQLVVRFRSPRQALVDGVEASGAVFTPNGDGMNDFFSLAYGLFKLIQPAPVTFSIFDLQGRQVRQGYAGVDLAGQYTRLWDGTDAQGRLVPPGIYLYRIEVDADTGHHNWQGTVEVAY